jgi:PTS system glucitol/sorbitol-specific IIA component
MTTVYSTTVTQIGELVESFRAAGYLVFFGANAPEELHDFCILHKVDSQSDSLQVGDVVTIGDTKLEVLAVGDVANENLMNLGHLNLKANGLQEAELPGDVNVQAGELPVLTVGQIVTITRN